jgi:threonine dehydratase
MSSSTVDRTVELNDIVAARKRIQTSVKRTPSVSATRIGELFGVDLYVKAELLQKTGSFKVRGVFNALLTLDSAARDRGVVSMSAGNHAAALAYGAREIGTAATIVMPTGASLAKVDATQSYGGEVIQTERPLVEVMTEVRSERGLTLIHPFDDPAIIAGAGTVGLELIEDTPDLDAVIVPVGGGGLISGVATAVKGRSPSTRVIGVEPETANACSRGLAAGHPVPLHHPRTVADGLAAPFVGEHNLRHIQRRVDEMVVVSDKQIERALCLIYERTKFAVEPAGAAGIAALLSGALNLPERARVIVVLSGGNVDRVVLGRIFSDPATQRAVSHG